MDTSEFFTEVGEYFGAAGRLIKEITEKINTEKYLAIMGKFDFKEALAYNLAKIITIDGNYDPAEEELLSQCLKAINSKYTAIELVSAIYMRKSPLCDELEQKYSHVFDAGCTNMWSSLTVYSFVAPSYTEEFIPHYMNVLGYMMRCDKEASEEELQYLNEFAESTGKILKFLAQN